MNNNFTTRQTKSVEPNETKKPLSWDQRPIWFAGVSFLILGFSISSTLNMVRKFPDDLFIVNWLPWFIALFFASGWLLTHWLEFVAFRKKKGIALILISVLLFGSLFFWIYFELFINHHVLSQFGLASTYLVLSGFLLRLSLFRDESFSFLQKTNPLRNK